MPLAPGNDSGRDEYHYFSGAFEQQIKTQRTNLCLASGSALVVLGLSLLSTWYLFRTHNLGGAALEYMKLGPVALSGITLPFPLRMLFSYRIRIPIYKGYKRLFDDAIAKRTTVNPQLIVDARAALTALHKVD